MASKRSAGIAAGVFGAVIVTVATYIAWDMRWRLPADALPPLPAEQTVMAFSGMDDAAWRRMVPVLNTLPPLPDPAPQHGALLRLPSGTLAWVTLTPGSRTLDQVPPDMRPMLAQVEHPLNASAVMRRLQGRQPWMILTDDVVALPHGKGTTPALLGLELGDAAVTASWQGVSLQRSGGSMLTATHTDVLRVFVRSPAALWAHAKSLLPPERALVTETLLVTAADDTWGDAFSPEEELFPLFHDAVTVERGGSGTLVYGIGADPRAADATLDRMHAVLATDANPVERLTVSTKEGFSIDTLRRGGRQPENTAVRRNGWTVRVTGSSERPLLASAVRGGEVFVATDPRLLEQALDAVSLPPPSLRGEGRLSAQALSSLATRLLPEWPLYKLVSVLNDSTRDGVVWTLEEDAGLWTLRLQTALAAPPASR